MESLLKILSMLLFYKSFFIVSYFIFIRPASGMKKLKYDIIFSALVLAELIFEWIGRTL